MLLGRELDEVGTVAVPPHVPYALDADVATTVLVIAGDSVSAATVGEVRRSVDPTRRLFEVSTARPTLPTAILQGRSTWQSWQRWRSCSVSANLLDASVAYVKQRKQLAANGSSQAIKHRLADVRIALDFAGRWCSARLRRGAGFRGQGRHRRRGVPRRPGRLQVQGEVGYTRELDLSLWILKVRALVSAWGTPAYHRPASWRDPLMELALTEEQQELASMLRSLLAKQADSAAVRTAMESEQRVDEALWTTWSSRSALPRCRCPRSTTASAPR